MAAGKVIGLTLNQAPRLAVNIAGKLKGLLGPKMYSKMGGLRGLQQVGQEGLYSGITTAELDTLTAETCAYMSQSHPTWPKEGHRRQETLHVFQA